MTVKVFFPGKIGDMLYALPTIRAIHKKHNEQVEVWTSEYCKSLQRLFERQTCVKSFNIASTYCIANHGCGTQPWFWKPPHILGDKVYQLGFRSYPHCSLINYIAGLAEVEPEHLFYEFDDATKEISDNYIIVAFGSGEPECQNTILNYLQIEKRKIVLIGGNNENLISGPNIIDKTGLDFVDCLPLFKYADAYVGTLSANTVIANGFNLPKVIICGNRHVPIHDIHTDSHLYLRANSDIKLIMEFING